MKEKKKFMFEVNLNRSSSTCYPCSQECKKISKKLNKRKLEEIEAREVPQLLKVFNF